VKLPWESPLNRSKNAKNGNSEAEPSEVRFRTWALVIAMLIGPPLLLFIYDKTMFPGLTNPDALDFAQVGRNLSEGRGFVTNFIRPIALTPGANPLALPDGWHGPLYPFLLALSFGLLGAKDTVAAGVSGLFYLLTIPLVFLLGRRVFNYTVGVISASIFTCNALLLEYAASGLHITLYIFLMTALLYVMYVIAKARSEEAERPALLTGKCVLAGVLTGLLYLTDPIFFWVMPFVAGAIVFMGPRRQLRALAMFGIPLALLVLPWMVRNNTLTGNPIFGMHGRDIRLGTQGHYPGVSVYRVFPEDLAPSVDLFKAVVEKILLGAGQAIEAFPEISASWVLAFFLPCLLFRFTDPATNILRRIMMWCFVGLLAGMLLFQVEMQVFVAIIPTMLVFAVAYLLHLIQQAALPRSGSAVVSSLLALAVLYPLASDMTLKAKPLPIVERTSALALGKAMNRKEIVVTDQPWSVAWYAGRPALWIPSSDIRLQHFHESHVGLRWIFLTERTMDYSSDWQIVYLRLQQWNLAVAQARSTNGPALEPLIISGNNTALAKALDGFSSIEPVRDAKLTTVIAALPESNTEHRLR
jgi:4-amino-4-deoxy-L-arabinose transferase-like glycosyltransferase